MSMSINISSAPRQSSLVSALKATLGPSVNTVRVVFRTAPSLVKMEASVNWVVRTPAWTKWLMISIVKQASMSNSCGVIVLMDFLAIFVKSLLLLVATVFVSTMVSANLERPRKDNKPMRVSVTIPPTQVTLESTASLRRLRTAPNLEILRVTTFSAPMGGIVVMKPGLVAIVRRDMMVFHANTSSDSILIQQVAPPVIWTATDVEHVFRARKAWII